MKKINGIRPIESLFATTMTWRMPKKEISVNQDMKWPTPVITFLWIRFLARLRLLEEKRDAAPRPSLANSFSMTNKNKNSLSKID